MQKAFVLAVDEVQAAQVCVGHAGWYAAVVLQADGLDAVQGLQVNLVDSGFIFEEYKGKPTQGKFKRGVNCVSKFFGKRLIKTLILIKILICSFLLLV